MNIEDYNILKHMNGCFQNVPETGFKLFSALSDQLTASQYYVVGALRYLNEFNTPFYISVETFSDLEKEKLKTSPLWESFRDYMELLQFNQQVAERGFNSSFESITKYHFAQLGNAFRAWMNTITGKDGAEDIATFAAKHAKLLRWVVREYPEAIRKIKPEYGFHFERDGYIKVAETDRMLLYQVLPTDDKVKVNKKGKPIIIVPPYVLGANIIGFLPQENKSYVHSYANQGIPTYVRIIKDIHENPAVQTMTGEDDTLDTLKFCEMLKDKYGVPVTLNGFCQGGFVVVANILTGKFEGLVDAIITCVAPMDGTRSVSLVEYLEHLPYRFRDLGYATKTLKNNNHVVDGKVMSWVYKLKSMEREAPLFTFYRDIMMFDRPNGQSIQISKTAAAINYWLIYDRTDLPVSITKMSFDSYTKPITKDGVLPIKLFDQKLDFTYIKEKGLKFLICYAEKDDLVDKPAALAPLDFIDAEVTVFPKGHGAIATSWSHPASKCALHTRFGDNYRGPVRFQLDLQEELRKDG